MKQFITYLVLILFTLAPVHAQTDAKGILDKTAQTFAQAGGIRAGFQIKNFSGQQQNGGSLSGTILLKGKKFKVTTAEMTTWFNGKTQWSYVNGNDEVNISEPTESELQTINPYTFLSFYQKGYSYKMGTTSRHQGHSIYEVQLTATSKAQSIRQVILLVDRKTYQPLQIKMREGSKNWMIINVTAYVKNQKLADSVFTFNKKDAPKAEIIDLR